MVLCTYVRGRGAKAGQMCGRPLDSPSAAFCAKHAERCAAAHARQEDVISLQSEQASPQQLHFNNQGNSSPSSMAAPMDNMCQWPLQRGPRRGECCGSKTVIDSRFCRTHHQKSGGLPAEKVKAEDNYCTYVGKRAACTKKIAVGGAFPYCKVHLEEMVANGKIDISRLHQTEVNENRVIAPPSVIYPAETETELINK